MPNEYGTFQPPTTVQPLPGAMGFPPIHQNNANYPELTELTNEQCPICRNAFVTGNSVAKLRTCGHVFHENCMLTFLGVPSIYLDPASPGNMYSCGLHKTMRCCGPGLYGWTCCMWQVFCLLPLCLNVCCPGGLHPRRIELSDSDIALLHKPDHPRFLADHMVALSVYSPEACNLADGGEWFYHSNKAECPICHSHFEPPQCYNLYKFTAAEAIGVPEML